MKLFDELNDPRWKLLSAAEERLDLAESREAVIEVVRSCARSVCSADGVCFVLREGDLCHYVEEDAISPLWKGQRFPIGACISGWSMLNAQTAVIEDVFADSRIPHDAYRPTFVKSLIMTPIGDTKPVAAIGAYWQEKRQFSASEIATIKTLSLIIGKALSYLV